MRAALAVVVLCTCLVACRNRTGDAPALPADPPASPAAAVPPPVFPGGDAGRLIARAIEVSGGWPSWQAHRDASFISTLTLFDPFGNPVSETIFLHRLPLHQGIKTRVDSIGITDEVVFGFDGEREWMLQGGRGVTASARVSFTRFHALSTAYWFSLPFVLAEIPAEFTYLGSESDGDRTYEKLRVGYADSVPLPFDWLVLYFDGASGKLDRVHVHAMAEFLRHPFWVGLWKDERDVEGIVVNRRRTFFAADPGGEIAGGMVGEQLTEHVDFDRGISPDLFALPPGARGLTAEIES